MGESRSFDYAIAFFVCLRLTATGLDTVDDWQNGLHGNPSVTAFVAVVALTATVYMCAWILDLIRTKHRGLR